jgi:hypothetical protein
MIRQGRKSRARLGGTYNGFYHVALTGRACAPRQCFRISSAPGRRSVMLLSELSATVDCCRRSVGDGDDNPETNN